jgi:hypothetical protein
VATLAIIALLIAIVAIAVHNNLQLERMNTRMDNFDIVLQKIDAATTATATRVAALIDSLKANGQTLTAEKQTEADAIVAHLTGIAADPAEPVPAATDTGSGS